jgi:hypothetical protein
MTNPFHVLMREAQQYGLSDLNEVCAESEGLRNVSSVAYTLVKTNA